MALKSRVMLSTDLMLAILNNTELLSNPEFEAEINKTIKLALVKVNANIGTVYVTKELTLEDKVRKGIATAEELLQFEEDLMNSFS